MPAPYIGRFAPTPSGYLHFGSLLTALASYLDARSHNGQWLVRIEDLDSPRNIPGASDHTLRILDAYGLHWDGPVVYQADRLALYQQVLTGWLETSQAYYCDCSRRDLALQGNIYPGTCRPRQLPAAADQAIRLRVDNTELTVTDRLQGCFSQRLDETCGDFVILRRDGIIAYQLAVVVDDIAQGVTNVVRGADLLESTPRQLWIYRLLQQTAPQYLHVPLVMRADGEKLSKRLGSAPLEPGPAARTLHHALEVLAQHPPAALAHAPVNEQLQWAIAHWQPQQLPICRQILEQEAPSQYR